MSTVSSEKSADRVSEYHVGKIVTCAVKDSAHQTQSVHAIQCLEAGKHVFIEKPMAQTIREADDIEAARMASGKLVFVGYMRRFATAFLRVKDMVGELESGDINYGESADQRHAAD